MNKNPEIGAFTTVAIFRNPEHANLAKAFLESYGLGCVIQNSYAVYSYTADVELQVRNDQVQDSRELLKQYFAEEGNSAFSGRLA